MLELQNLLRSSRTANQTPDFSRMLKNAHLRRCPHPSSLRRTFKYASGRLTGVVRVAPYSSRRHSQDCLPDRQVKNAAGALPLAIFEHPAKADFFSNLLVLPRPTEAAFPLPPYPRFNENRVQRDAPGGSQRAETPRGCTRSSGRCRSVIRMAAKTVCYSAAVMWVKPHPELTLAMRKKRIARVRRDSATATCRSFRH